MGIMLKQFESIGFPCWRKLPPHLVGDVTPIYRLFGQCSDRGPDQSKLRKYIAHEIRNSPYIFYFDWDCTLHQAALMFKSSLQCIDGFLRSAGKDYTYYSSIAKLINCWRENCWAVFLLWSKHSRQSAMKYAYRQPPRCLAGRWGSIYATESLLMHVSCLLPTFLGEVLKKKITADIDVRDKEEVDDLRVEAQTEYRRRQGRWSRDTIATMDDLLFWGVVRIAQRHHGILNDLMTTCNRFNFSRIGMNKEVLLANNISLPVCIAT